MVKSELLIDSGFDNISLDVLQRLVAEKEQELIRKEILSQYPIKQLPPPDGRFWCRINGVTKFSISKEKLEQKIIKLAKDSERDRRNPSICSIFENYLVMRKIRVAETTWANDLKYKRFYLENSDIYVKPLRRLSLDDAYSFFEHVKKTKAILAKDRSSGVTPGLTQKYWSNVRCFMSCILEYAIECRYCDYNPFKTVYIHSDSFTESRITPPSDAVFSDDERYRVCALAELDHEETHDSLPLAIPLLFQTGLRDGELVALKWGDIEGKWLHVQRESAGVVDENGYVRGRCIKPRCKTIRSVRYIELSTDARNLLTRIRATNAENGYPTGHGDFVFYRTVKETVTTCTERCFAGRLAKYCKHANMVVSKSPHDIRRTCLTNMYRSGVPIAYVQAFAGHESQKQTEQYLKLTIKDIAQNDYTSYLNIDKNKLSEYKNGNIPNKVIPLPERA